MRELRVPRAFSEVSLKPKCEEKTTKPKKARPAALLAIYKHCKAIQDESEVEVVSYFSRIRSFPDDARDCPERMDWTTIHRKVLFKYEYFYEFYKDMELLVQNVNLAFTPNSKEKAAVDILWKAFCAYLEQKGYMKDVAKHKIYEKEQGPKSGTMLAIEPPKPPTPIPSLPECYVKLHKIDVAKEKSRIERPKSSKSQPKSKPRELKLMQKTIIISGSQSGDEISSAPRDRKKRGQRTPKPKSVAAVMKKFCNPKLFGTVTQHDVNAVVRAGKVKTIGVARRGGDGTLNCKLCEFLHPEKHIHGFLSKSALLVHYRLHFKSK